MKTKFRYQNKPKEKLNKAFRELRKLGYFAKQNFQCCGSCGWAAIPKEKREKAVFYHSQDNAFFKEKGQVYLAWNGNGSEIESILRANGILTKWNGTNEERIQIVDLDPNPEIPTIDMNKEFSNL